MNKLLLAALSLLLLLPLAAFAETPWKSYTNGRFGFKISFPASLVASPDPTNGGGREYHSKDKEFSMSVFGHFLIESTLESMWQDELKELGDSITYKKKAKDWYVVSGVKDGVEYYHKTCTQDRNYAGFNITYPHAKAKQYDPWVEQIAKSFMPFLKGDYDRLEK